MRGLGLSVHARELREDMISAWQVLQLDSKLISVRMSVVSM